MRDVIAYVVPVGKGLDSFVYREIERLVAMGLRIVLFSTKYKEGDVYSPKPDWKCYTLSFRKFLFVLPVMFVRALSKPKLLFHALRYGAIAELVFAIYYSPRMIREGARQIHCHFGDRKLFIGYYCRRITGLPLSVTIHSHELHVNPNEKLFRVALKECSKIFGISQLAVDLLVQKYGAPADRVVLNRLCVDINEWRSRRPLRVISVGRFEEQKGFDYLFKAAALLNDIDMEFVVVGFGPLDVKDIARRIGVQTRVVFFEKLGHQQLQLLYQSCDIYCLPSISHPEQGMEGIPVVLMEAMACGLPVVATSAGAVPEIVKEILVEEKSPEALAKGIRYLVENEDARRRQGTDNRERVAQEYSMRNIEDLFDEFHAIGSGQE